MVTSCERPHAHTHTNKTNRIPLSWQTSPPPPVSDGQPAQAYLLSKTGVMVGRLPSFVPLPLVCFCLVCPHSLSHSLVRMCMCVCFSIVDFFIACLSVTTTLIRMQRRARSDTPRQFVEIVLQSPRSRKWFQLYFLEVRCRRSKLAISNSFEHSR